jgi:hypothetical protein
MRGLITEYHANRASAVARRRQCDPAAVRSRRNLFAIASDMNHPSM